MKEILLIDDESEARGFIARFLLKIGYKVSEADNGKKALELLKERLPDIIICDVMMPVMDGHEFTKTVKTDPLYKYIPLIMLTALADFQQQSAGISIGADDYLIKPVDLEQLRLRIMAMERIKELYKELMDREAEHQNELAMAQTVQSVFLPSDLSGFDKAEIITRYMPAKKLSGDLYDIKKLSDDKYFLIIADVSGHGIPASLIMASFKIMLLRYFQTHSENLEDMLFSLNNEFVSLNFSPNFITVFACIFDFKNNSMDYINAGHTKAIHIIGNDIKLIEANSEGLGFFSDRAFTKESVGFNSSDIFLFYTDGLISITNPSSNKCLKVEELLSIIKNKKDITLNAIFNILDKEIIKFKEVRPIDDDIAIIGFSIK